MKLVDLRKFAIGKQERVRFRLANGLECVMDERGVALVPELRAVPDFNLERELESVASFIVEPLNLGQKNAAKARTLDRAGMAALLVPASAAAVHHDEHDDE